MAVTDDNTCAPKRSRLSQISTAVAGTAMIYNSIDTCKQVGEMQEEAQVTAVCSGGQQTLTWLGEAVKPPMAHHPTMLCTVVRKCFDTGFASI